MFGWVSLGFVPTFIFVNSIISRYKLSFDKKFRFAEPKSGCMFR